jgi:hypothetical protein
MYKSDTSDTVPDTLKLDVADDISLFTALDIPQLNINAKEKITRKIFLRFML